MKFADAASLAPAAPPASYSKAAAILGGAPSSLDLIRMQQSGLSAPVQTVATIAPASSMVANPEAACALSPLAVTTASAIADDRLVLGSMRIAIRRTPFDEQWSKVSRASPARSMLRWVQRTGANGSGSERDRIGAINRWVNGAISYADDIDLYGKKDFWATSRETLRRGKGDCEDFAILKMDLLSAMGIDRDRMTLVIARDLVRNADHALLVVRLDQGSVVLDNSTDRLLDGRLANDYRPIMSFASNGKWLHGYAVAAVAPTAALPAEGAIAPSMPAIALSGQVSAGN